MKADIGLTETSKNCTENAGGITCTVDIKLKPGAYTGALTTYDGPVGCQAAVTSCHVLSFKQRFPLSIAAGKIDVPRIVLTGVPHYVKYLDVDTGTIVDRVPDAAQFGMVGPNAKGRIELYAGDYDGNLILGPGAPSFTVTTGGGFGGYVSGNVLLLTAPALMIGWTEPLTIKAHSVGCKAPGANCTLVGSTQFQPLIAIAETAANAVAIYTAHITERLPFATIQSGISSPRAVTFDTVGHLFVANANATVTEYAPPYTSHPIATFSSGLQSPAALAVAPGTGDLAVADAVANAVVLFAPPSNTPVATIALSGAPTSLFFDPANELWVASTGAVAQYIPPYTGAPKAALNGSNGIHVPVAVTIDNDGNLTVADAAGGGAIDAFKSPYTGGPAAQISYPNPTQVITVGDRVVACGQGDILFLNVGTLSTNVDLPFGDGGTQMCAVDAYDYLYEGDAVYGDFGEYDPTGYSYYGTMVESISQPSALAAFPHV